HWASFLPEELNIDGNLLPQKKHRGIYEVSVYSSELNLSGKFIEPDFDFGFDSIEVDMSKAQVVFGVTDSRGIDQIELNSSIGKIPYTPGAGACELFTKGVHFKLDLTDNKELDFEIPLKLKGSYGFNMLPLGKSTKARLKGEWSDPKFQGAHLPDSHNIDNELNTFEANWEVLDLNRSFPQKFLAANLQTNGEGFGVELHMPVSQYQKNMRAAKYAVLFIALTFLCFFFVQVIKKIKIHFVQYLLVGFALCLFYVLLLSFSEVIGFNYAYLIATLAVILQICLYIKSVTKNTRITLMLGGLLGLLYTFVFSIIQMEERSLLFGSIGLFIILGAIMYLSRSVQWNNMAKE
ncbi:MAG: cell envelope integrity protein CreD, partial [Flavobacteriales bacterium]